MLDRAKEKARKIARRFRDICGALNLVHFWTLTFYPELSPVSRMDRWNAFITTLRGYYPGLQYIGVKELHPGGNGIHLHVLFDRYVDWHIAREIWERVGAGKVLLVKKIPTCYVVRYVTKYVTKSIESEEVRRPVLASRNFCIHLTDFLKWTEKMLGYGCMGMLRWILDNIDVREYTKVAGLRKRRHLYRLLNIGLSLGL